MRKKLYILLFTVLPLIWIPVLRPEDGPRELEGTLLWLAVLGPPAYILGSVPFGLLVARFFCGVDPRLEGSRNVGATNVARLCGLPCGILTLVCDALKGLLPVCSALYGPGAFTPQWAGLVGLCALLGHLHSVFLGFRGGKAVATSIGVFLPLSFPVLLLSGLLCLLAIWRSGYVSLGSLLLAASLPVFLLILGRLELLPLALTVLALVFVKHRENIKRLLAGEEKSFLKRGREKERKS
ncbi:MAG: glycerol-3-phosphate 1-O-acyltransferase PlsY [Deltaproteobacteria bacterium]|jgi:glycerol-3-phosphate acyltransferase PlsY|nr:glycerol-3-phosphate 1-O-acyltransferase PlsY [Deltaproteobacteria bacterium]